MTPKAFIDGPRPESATLLQIKHWKEEARNKSRASTRTEAKKPSKSSPISPKDETKEDVD